MKKFIFVVFVLFVQVSTAQAAIFALLFGEKVASENFNVGMEFGIPYARISNDLETSSKTGITFGIAGNVKINANWSLHPTAYFLSRRGGAFESLSLNSNDLELNNKFKDAPTELTLGYIDIPVFINYRFTDSNFKIGIAPQISFLTNSEAVFTNAQGNFETAIKEVTNSRDFGMIFQLGYIAYSQKFNQEIHIQLRYLQGFTNVYDDSFVLGTNKSSYLGLAFSLPFLAKVEKE